MSVDRDYRDCVAWYSDVNIPPTARDVSETRDLFNARMGQMVTHMQSAGAGTDSLSLLAAVVGEIGNNCFDHNLGQWRDQPGCMLGFAVASGTARVWIADRGRGMRASLANVLPEIQSDQEAIDIAFRKVVSGRAPERRGNGLKFVRSVINGSDEKGLYCVSGGGRISFGGAFARLANAVDSIERKTAPGVLAVLEWKLS